MRKLILAAIALIALAAPLAVTPAHGAVAMSKTQAGNYYMRHVCPLNDATDRFNRVVFGKDGWIGIREVRQRLFVVKQEARRYGLAEHRFARALYNPPSAWPSGVRYHVNTLARLHTRSEGFRARQGRARTAGGWLYWNGRANNLPWGSNAAVIRARLDLPAPGRGC